MVATGPLLLNILVKFRPYVVYDERRSAKICLFCRPGNDAVTIHLASRTRANGIGINMIARKAAEISVPIFFSAKPNDKVLFIEVRLDPKRL